MGIPQTPAMPGKKLLNGLLSLYELITKRPSGSSLYCACVLDIADVSWGS